MKTKYKVRQYYTKGKNKGNIKNEFFFDNKENALNTYNCLYSDRVEGVKYKVLISVNPSFPTATKFKICLQNKINNTPIGDIESLRNSEIMVFDGDYTSNPPTYEEVANHGGKYKVEYKVTGKNKFNKASLRTKI